MDLCIAIILNGTELSAKCEISKARHDYLADFGRTVESSYLFQNGFTIAILKRFGDGKYTPTDKGNMKVMAEGLRHLNLVFKCKYQSFTLLRLSVSIRISAYFLNVLYGSESIHIEVKNSEVDIELSNLIHFLT